MKKLLIVIFIFLNFYTKASQILIPMDESQTNHLKAYGVTFWVLENGLEANWLLNYRGGSFLLPYRNEIVELCVLRNVSYQILSDAEVNSVLNYISKDDVNMDKIKLEKAPRIAVYAPKVFNPWDDAVTLALNFAEIPFTQIYDEEVLRGDLKNYDWLHLHHEDFTGQYGKFWGSYQNASWYQNEVKSSEEEARKLGFAKVSQLKLAVAKTIKDYIFNGGYLFAMCSGTDSYDIALSAEGLDICQPMFDGDPIDPSAQGKLNYSNCFAFQNFKLVTDPYTYEYSDIDVTNVRKIQQSEDYFTLFEFSAKWDPVPTMLCQNHTRIIKGFMGQTTAFNSKLLKPNVIVMGEFKNAGEARYIHGEYGQGTWTFYSGHDPEDYQQLVGDPPTDLKLFPNSPGYRLILNNVLFPAAQRKKQKT